MSEVASAGQPYRFDGGWCCDMEIAGEPRWTVGPFEDGESARWAALDYANRVNNGSPVVGRDDS